MVGRNNRFGWVVTALLVSACGYSEGQFKDEYLDLYCGASAACADSSTGVSISFGSEEDCKTFLGAFLSLGTAGCDYDPGAAKACVDALGAASCDALVSGEGTTSCDAVYSGATCGWASTSTGGTTSSL